MLSKLLPSSWIHTKVLGYAISKRYLYNLGSFLPSCRSCGITLQASDPKKDGFYVVPKQATKLLKNEDLIFNKHMEKLSQEEKSLLINDTNQSYSSPERLNLNTELKPEGLECLRCRKAKYQNVFDWKELPCGSVDSVLTDVPPNADIIYVVNALDFPAGIDRSIFKYRSPKEIKFVITKSDLIFSSVQMSQKYGSIFFKDYLSKVHGADPSNVFVVSGKSDWNIKQLMLSIKDDTYIVGNTNSGKSTLIKSLLNFETISSNAYTNSKEKKTLDKLTNLAMNSGISKAQIWKAKKQIKSKAKDINGPGTSFMPGFTRNYIHYDIRGKNVTDVPGFNALENHGVYQHLSPQSARLLSKGANAYKFCSYSSPYVTLKPGQIYTVGGLFFLEASSDSMLQIKKCINFDFHIFRDMEKAKSSLHSIESNPALSPKFIVDKEAYPNLKRYIIPPFFGPIDLVINNIGFITISPTGKRNNNKLLSVYLPRHVEAFIRRPIIQYTSKSLSGRDKNGNKLKSENLKSKSTKVLKLYNGKTPFSSLLLPSPGIDEDFEVVSNTISKFRGNDLIYDSSTEINDSNKHSFWIDI